MIILILITLKAKLYSIIKMSFKIEKIIISWLLGGFYVEIKQIGIQQN